MPVVTPPCIPPQLQDAIARFKKEYPDVLHVRNTRGWCLQWSCDFAEFLAENDLCGYKAVQGAMDPDGDGWPVVEMVIWPDARAAPATRHFALRVGVQVVDWTARQFVPRCALPLVYAEADLRHAYKGALATPGPIAVRRPRRVSPVNMPDTCQEASW